MAWRAWSGARCSIRYQFTGLTREEALKVAGESLYNPVIQVLMAEGEKMGFPEAPRDPG